MALAASSGQPWSSQRSSVRVQSLSSKVRHCQLPTAPLKARNQFKLLSRGPWAQNVHFTALLVRAFREVMTLGPPMPLNPLVQHGVGRVSPPEVLAEQLQVLIPTDPISTSGGITSDETCRQATKSALTKTSSSGMSWEWC